MALTSFAESFSRRDASSQGCTNCVRSIGKKEGEVLCGSGQEINTPFRMFPVYLLRRDNVRFGAACEAKENMAGVEGFEPSTLGLESQVGRAISLILRHSWQRW